MTWRISKHVDMRRKWPDLDCEVSPSIELALRALWLLYNRGEDVRDAYDCLQEIHYSTDTFAVMYWHRHGHVKIYLYSEPNRIKSLALQFDLEDVRKWNVQSIGEVLDLMRKVMVLDELAST